MALKENLIRHGYVPKEFVPAFKSVSFADALGGLSKQTEKHAVASRCCYHSIPRLKQFRRIISFPNPLHQATLAGVLEAHWGLLSALMNSSTISLSTLEEDASGYSALRRKIGFEDLAVEKALRSTAGRFALRADLSRFYHTLYTHSVPWALHTKDVAKSRKTDRTLPGNSIDAALRATQDQQTLGIPVGPETSDLVAEVVASAIDNILQSDIPQLSGIRYIDDFNLYFGTRADAEQGLGKQVQQ